MAGIETAGMASARRTCSYCAIRNRLIKSTLAGSICRPRRPCISDTRLPHPGTCGRIPSSACGGSRIATRPWSVWVRMSRPKPCLSLIIACGIAKSKKGEPPRASIASERASTSGRSGGVKGSLGMMTLLTPRPGYRRLARRYRRRRAPPTGRAEADASICAAEAPSDWLMNS